MRKFSRTSILLLGFLSFCHCVSGMPWQTYTNGRFGFSISFPPGILMPHGESENGDGQVFSSKDGKTVLTVFGAWNIDDKSLKTLFEEAIKEEKKVTYRILREKKNFFVISGFRGEKIFYLKTGLFKGAMKTLVFEYDKNESEVFNKVTEALAKSFKFEFDGIDGIIDEKPVEEPKSKR